jgi:hypothetical protein
VRRVLRICSTLIVIGALGSFAESVSASMAVRHMNLQQMCDAAGRIFRGTVLGVKDGAVTVGGAQLATVVYRLRVDEAFKGSFESYKDEPIATIQMIRPSKTSQIGPVRHLSAFDDLPRFEQGHDYLILATATSVAGLSTTVGLGQGAFKVGGKVGQEIAVNGNNNIGLYTGMNVAPVRGPVALSTLRTQIRNLVRR